MYFFTVTANKPKKIKGDDKVEEPLLGDLDRGDTVGLDSNLESEHFQVLDTLLGSARVVGILGVRVFRFLEPQVLKGIVPHMSGLKVHISCVQYMCPVKFCEVSLKFVWGR